MSLDDNMIKIMNVVRHFTGDTDKLSFDDAIDSLMKLKANKLAEENVDWNKITDFNTFIKPGIYSVWNKPMKNSPMPNSDQGSIVIILGNGDWTLQLLFTFYSGLYYRADTKGALSEGHVKWNKVSTSVVGGVTEPVLIGFAAPRLEVAA